MDTPKVKIVVLAAGKGTRMKSEGPKVLAPLRGSHMIKHLLDSIDESKIDSKPIIVVGHKKELVMGELGDKYVYVVQDEQRGVGHALLSARAACGNAEHIIMIAGDQPFIKTETIKNLLSTHLESGAKMTFSTTMLPDFEEWRMAFKEFGRIIRENNKVALREYRDATDTEKKIKEVNASCYAFDAKWLWENLEKIDKSERGQKENYLVDLWTTAEKDGDKIESIKITPEEALGANTKEELEIITQFAVQ